MSNEFVEISTYKLERTALDWAVGVCAGHDDYIATNRLRAFGRPTVGICNYPDADTYWPYAPSTDWAQGGPIIERERICIDIGHDGVWLAYTKQNYDDEKEFMQSGPTPLVAAMRCYIASDLGKSVKIPKELM